ncbi:MAG: TSUP family transporter [Deltaproteobacteria bacterium]|jgi:uncharacterized membrane protein YfcA|nr:TSUP family transporter [Deltaproteobacteria bacterium]
MIALLGVLAGLLTTVAGLGGGVLLVLALSALSSPQDALAATAPALLVGNLHRAWLYRGALDRRTARTFAEGALPGSLVGGWVAAWLPTWALSTLMIVGVALALLRALGWIKTEIPDGALRPAAAGIGALAATSGGAAGLAGGLLLARGLKGETYVATASIAAVSLHLGRMVAYASAGLFTEELVVQAGILAATIGLGNLLGLRIRAWLPQAITERAEVGALILACGLALAGPFTS